MKKTIKFVLFVCIILILSMLVFTACGSDKESQEETNASDATPAPILMTAEYLDDEENYYGYKILEDDFRVYLHYADGTKQITKKFIIENEDCYLIPENTVKTFNLKSTEYDLKASVDIQIPKIQSFPESREIFVQNYYAAMKGIGITQYTMELKKAENGNVIGANFRDSKGAYWYFLSLSNQTNNNTSSDFDEVKIETNIQYNKEEMEKMKLLLISQTIPAGSYTAIEAYSLLQKNDGNLTAKNVKYSSYFNTGNNSTNYYLIASMVQLKAYSADGNTNTNNTNNSSNSITNNSTTNNSTTNNSTTNNSNNNNAENVSYVLQFSDGTYVNSDTYTVTNANNVTKELLGMTNNINEATIFSIKTNTDGSVSIMSGTEYLYADGEDVRFVSRPSEYTNFIIENKADGVLIKCKTATYNGNPQYLEVYYGGYLTCYGLNENDLAIYTFKFVEVQA